ncbi:ATP-binding cassette domain-containing protein [Rhodopirellula sp. JC639]|uniref:ATP-binding cassette domain-containing protein n=1 Tax=Stieleria mannarensis TaxID=2755585 RepID=UPI0025710D71|nr:ATP-binding cassette domain-containing protein [Rhodopirellula sp. JC639]
MQNRSSLSLCRIGIDKARRKCKHIDDVHLREGHGELVAIKGARGSGKSTLLHAMAGLIDVDEGQVVIAGQKDSSETEDARRIGTRRATLATGAFARIPSFQG